MIIRPRLFAFLFACALAVSAHAQTFIVTDLGAIEGAPTYATAINEHGVICGYSLPDAASARAWIWREGKGFTDAGSLGGADRRGFALGADDKLYGCSQNAAGVSRGFVWDGAALADLGSLAAGDAVSAESVNASGAVAGFTTTSGALRAFRFAGGKMTALGTLAGADQPAASAAYGINDAGRIVGTASWTGGGSRAFRTDAGGALVALGTLGGNDSWASAINTGGQVAGSSTTVDGATRAFLFSDAGGMRDLGVLAGGMESRAFGIDDSGAVVGTSEDAAGNTRAFLWLPGGMRDLNELIPPNSGWVLREARDINNAGDIVGYGTLHGVDRAFLLERFERPDTFAPVATAAVTPPEQGAAETRVTVKFWDNEKVVASTARAEGAIRIVGPNGYDAPAGVVGNDTGDGLIVSVIFTAPAPGGAWEPRDNGAYEVRVAGDQVSDIAGNKLPGGVIATFHVALEGAPTLDSHGTLGAPVRLSLSADRPRAEKGWAQFRIALDADGGAPLPAPDLLTAGLDTQPPTAPKNPAVLPPPRLTTSSAAVTWTASTDNEGVAGYRIFTRRIGGTRWQRVAYYSQIGATAETAWNFTNLLLCSTGTFYLAAVDAAGNRSAYTPVTIKVVCEPGGAAGAAAGNASAGPAAVEGEKFTSFTFTGDGNPAPVLTPAAMPAGAEWIALAPNAGFFTWTPGPGGDANYTPSAQPVTPGTATFRLTSAGLGGASTQTYTVPVWPKGTDLIPPEPVTALDVDNISDGACRIVWKPAADNRGVVAQRITVAHRAPRSRFHRGAYDDHVVTADVPGGVGETTVTGLRANTSYAVSVIARDEAGVAAPGSATGLWSAPGVTRIFSTRPAPFAVAGVKQTVNPDGSMTMTWPNQGFYWRYTVQFTDSLAKPDWQPVPPADQWPSFYVNSFTFKPDPKVPSRFYRVFATPGL